MIVDQKLKESEISEQDSLLSKHFARTRNLPRIAIFNISYIRGLFPEKYFNDKSVPALDHTQDPAENEQQLARVKNWISLRHTDNVELTDVLSNFTYISMILTEEIMDKLVQDGYLLKPGRDTYIISKTKASECEFSAVKEEMDGQVVPHGDKALQNVGEDYTYTKALYHALPMDYVTVAKLQNKLEGEGNQTTVRKLFDKISREGYIEAKSNQRPGVYDALQKNYLRSLLFCNCETLEGPMIQEYTFSFSYSNSDNQEVSMNINSTCTKEGTFNCGSLTEVTPNQMRSSACNMVRILIQWMRTLDKMPEQVNQPQEDLEGEAEQVEGEAEMEGVGGEEIGGEGGQGDGDGSDNEGEEIGGEWGSDDDGDDSDDNGDDSDDDEDNNNEEEAEEEEEEEAEAEVVDEQGAVLDDQQQGNVAQCPPQSWKDVRALKAKADQAFDDSRNFFHLGRDNPDYVKAKRKAIDTMLEHHEAMLRVFFHGEVHDDAIVGAAVVPIGGEATEETNGVVEEGVGAAVGEVVPTVVVEEQVLAPVVAAEKLVEEEAVEEDIVPDMLFNNKGNFCGESSAKRKR